MMVLEKMMMVLEKVMMLWSNSKLILKSTLRCAQFMCSLACTVHFISLF